MAGGQHQAEEVASGLRLRGIDPTQFPADAWWIYEVKVKQEAVLDLTDSDVLQKLAMQTDTLTGSEVHATREIAAEARSAGFQALIAPSTAASGSKNLVIFLDKLPEPPIVSSSRAFSFQGESP